MKQFLGLILFGACLTYVSALDFESELAETEVDPRLFFVNFTSSLVQVNATILAYGLLFLAVLGAAAVALYYLYLESQNSSGSAYGSSYGSNNYNYNYARSSQDGYEFGGYNILEWISTLRDAYENFDYNDIECQKRLICDVLREPTMLGVNGQTIKNTFQMAKYLELMNLPDEVREILDEYMDAESRAEQNKDCKEFFTCPFSISDSYKAYKRPVTAGNDL